MSKSNGSQKSTKSKERWELRGYLDLSLSKGEKDLIKKFPVGNGQFESVVQSLAFSGYKLSMSFSKHQDLWFFSVTGKDVPASDKGYVLMIRHADFSSAVQILCWFYEQAGEGETLFTSLLEDEGETW